MTDTVKKNTAAGHIQLGAREIIEALPEHMHRRENFTLIYKEETGSTNADAMQLLHDGAMPDGGALPPFFAVVAGRQTGGRGTQGRHFYSPSGSGLYMSIAWHSGLHADGLPPVTAAAAVAVRFAVGYVLGQRADIKWVNDVLVDGKKVCGILAECSERSDGADIVIGIGINLTPPEGGFPPELGGAGALCSHMEPEVAEELAASVIAELCALLDGGSADEIMSRYREGCCSIGGKLRLRRDGGAVEYTALDIGDDGELIVESPDGERLTVISAAEICRPAERGNY